MFQTLRNAWKIADLRKKLLYTLMIIAIFRIGAAIPVPFLNPEAISAMIHTSGNLLGYLDILSGGSFAQCTLFALSISPHITSSIVIQLLTVAIPALERLAKEGEEGRKRLEKITRYTMVALALLQATAYYLMLKNFNAVQFVDGGVGMFTAAVIILTFTGGSCLLVWLGEQIDKKGIGNGISMILFAGIVSRASSMVNTVITELYLAINGIMKYWFIVPFTLVLFLAAIVFIVIMTNAERRIPVQYAQRVVGRKMYGGQSTHIPIKVNMSGVLPIIFAQSIASLPVTIWTFIGIPEEETVSRAIYDAIDTQSFIYMIVYFIMIIGFSYFYSTIQFNPVEIANNLKKQGGFIPGFRPGKPTVDFIKKVLSKITLFGAIYLGIVAICPLLLGKAVGNAYLAIGGTSVIIVVGVALETVKALEAQMLMRQYKGFLE